MADQTEVEYLAGLVLGAQRAPQVFDTGDGRKFVALPASGDSWKLEQVTLPNAASVLQPKTVVQHVRMQSVDSLIAYIDRFKNKNTILFADTANDTILAIIDYHGESTPGDPTEALIAHRSEHTVSLNLPTSLEWQTWTKASGVLMSHTGFATFLEENSMDVFIPAGSDLLELCRDLQVIQNVKFGSSVRMGDVTEINYQKESDASAKGSVTLPQEIALSLPVYFGEAKIVLKAFMRRKIEDGVLRLGVQLSRADNVRQNEFQRIVEHVMDEVGLTTVYGTPA